MITNFEEETKELTEKELAFIPMLIAGFRTYTKDNPIKAPEIVKKMNKYLEEKKHQLRLTQPRLRKCCNYIRANGILPLVASNKGYYVSTDPEEIKKQIQSLQERARSINDCAKGLEKFLDHETAKKAIEVPKKKTEPAQIEEEDDGELEEIL